MVNKDDNCPACDIMRSLSRRYGSYHRDTDLMKVNPIEIIRKKMDGFELTPEEIFVLVRAISDNRLSEMELASYVTSLYIKTMNPDEISYLACAMAECGDVIDFDSPAFDFHSIGGLPGNKITPIIVGIAAAGGLLIPKLASRAISSACGTADIVELFSPVSFTGKQLHDIALSAGGTIAWGGGLGIVPADDIVIKAEFSLGIYPRAQMIASIMSKKIAAGINHLVLDIPVGQDTKAHTIEEGNLLAREFTDIGRLLGIDIRCVVTFGNQPLGYAVGPALESIEAIRILEGYDHPISVIDKACSIAGLLLEMGGTPEGEGKEKARKILESGEALAAFRKIIEAQGGLQNITSDMISPGKYSAHIYAEEAGYVSGINNKYIVRIARAAGSPEDKGAGVLMAAKSGKKVKAGDLLYTIYADDYEKLAAALHLAERLQPYRINGIILNIYP